MRQLDLFGTEPPKEPVPVQEASPAVSSVGVQEPGSIAVREEKPVIQFQKTGVPEVSRVVDPEIGFSHKISPIQTSGKRGRKSFKEMDAQADLIEVPEDEILFQKKYYTISEVAGWFKVNNSLLRFWENEFEVLKPRKNRKGDRLFRPEDIKTLQTIYYLLRERKFSIEGARKYLKENKKTEAGMQLMQSLTKFKAFLLELKTHLMV